MNGSELYDMFASDAPMEDIARVGVEPWVVQQILELRQHSDDHIDMTDREITEAIVAFAQEEMQA